MGKMLEAENINSESIEVLKNFEHYEVSNFGKPSRHNLNYWNNENYYGFGVASHGYVGNVRYSNSETIEDYIENPLSHKEEKTLTLQEQLEEEIFLGFRKMSGIDTLSINQKFGINFEEKYQQILKKYSGFFIKTERGYTLNTRGIMISNTILSEFLQ